MYATIIAIIVINPIVDSIVFISGLAIALIIANTTKIKTTINIYIVNAPNTFKNTFQLNILLQLVYKSVRLLGFEPKIADKSDVLPVTP